MTEEEIFANEVLIVDSPCKAIRVNRSFRGIGGANTFSGASLDDEKYPLVNGSKLIYIGFVDFGYGASLFVGITIHAVIGKMMYIEQQGEHIIVDCFDKSGDIAYDSEGYVSIHPVMD